MINYIHMIGRYWELLVYRAHAELMRDLKRAYLGILWWYLEPLLYLAVFYLVFGLGLRKGGSDFVVYLLTGLIVWKWFDGSVKSSSGIISSSVGLMNHVYLPKLILPGMIILTNTYKFLTVLLMFLVFLVFVWHLPITQYWIALPLLVFLQLILICGVAGLASAIVPVIPDFKYIVDYGMTLAFFMSGIFFDIHELTPGIQHLLMINPMVVMIESYRDILLYTRWPDWQALQFVSYEALLVLVMALVMLIRLDRYYPRVVG